MQRLVTGQEIIGDQPLRFEPIMHEPPTNAQDLSTTLNRCNSKANASIVKGMCVNIGPHVR